MLYLDNQYQNDCAKKIQYDTMKHIDVLPDTIGLIKNEEYQIYEFDNNVYLIKVNDNLSIQFNSSDHYAFEIAPFLYKIV